MLQSLSRNISTFQDHIYRRHQSVKIEAYSITKEVIEYLIAVKPLHQDLIKWAELNFMKELLCIYVWTWMMHGKLGDDYY